MIKNVKSWRNLIEFTLDLNFKESMLIYGYFLEFFKK